MLELLANLREEVARGLRPDVRDHVPAVASDVRDEAAERAILIETAREHLRRHAPAHERRTPLVAVEQDPYRAIEGDRPESARLRARAARTRVRAVWRRAPARYADKSSGSSGGGQRPS